MDTIICYVSGRARGNPGPSAIGVHIVGALGVTLQDVAKAIGNGTDNFATYYAVLVGLQTLETLLGSAAKNTHIELCLDNELVKKQLNAEQEINDPGSVPLFIEIHNRRVASFPQLTVTLVSPNQNDVAYQLVNEALDGK